MRILMTALGLAVLTAAAMAPFQASAQAQAAVVADDRAERLVLAERYLSMTLSPEMFATINDEITRSFEEADDLSTEERVWLTANFAPLINDVLARTVTDMREPVADLFTVVELEAMIEFNSTPVGAAIARKSARMGTDLQNVMAPHMLTAMTSLMEKYCTRFDCGSDATGAGAAAAKSGR